MVFVLGQKKSFMYVQRIELQAFNLLKYRHTRTCGKKYCKSVKIQLQVLYGKKNVGKWGWARGLDFKSMPPQFKTTLLLTHFYTIPT